MTVPDDLISQDELVRSILVLKTVSVIDPGVIYVGNFETSDGNILGGDTLLPNNDDYLIIKDLEFMWSVYEFKKDRLRLNIMFAEEENIS